MDAHITRRYFVKGLGLLSASAALTSCSSGAETTDTTISAESEEPTGPLVAIVYTNDTHGHDMEVEATDENAGNFSMAAVPALVKDYKSKGYEVLLFDCGDANQGMPLVDNSAGDTAFDFMNACNYQLMTLGNHEFDHGPDQIDSYEKKANFPLISANVLLKETGERRFEAHKVFDLDCGIKIGVFGLTTPSTVTVTSPKSIAPYSFLDHEDLYACAREQVAELKDEGADIIVCMGHLGNQKTNRPNTSREVIENVEGIDLFIDGHDHKLVEEEVGKTLLVETGCYMANIGTIVIDGGKPQNATVAYGEFTGVDQVVQSVLNDANDQVQKELNVPLGHSDYYLDGERDHVRSEETNLGDFLADALLWGVEQEAGQEFDGCLVNGGGIRDSIAASDITLLDIKTVLPFVDETVVLKIRGDKLLEALEASTQSVGLEGTIGAFPQVAGITFTVDASIEYESDGLYPDSTYAKPKSPGSRVNIQKIGGQDFDENKTYSIVTLIFLCEGGDTYYTFKEAAEAETPITYGIDFMFVADYLKIKCANSIPKEYAEPQGRIIIKNL